MQFPELFGIHRQRALELSFVDYRGLTIGGNRSDLTVNLTVKLQRPAGYIDLPSRDS
jgi:hypothetical protein